MAGISMDRKTVYSLVIKLDGDVDPSLLDALKQTRRSFDQIDIGGMNLSKTFLEMGRQGDLSFGSLLNGINLVQSGAVSVGSAFGSLGIGLAMKGAELGLQAVKWGLEQVVDIIKEGVGEAANLETVMMSVAKVTPGLRNESGIGYSPLYAQYEKDIRELGIEYATLGYEGIGDIYAQGARGGIGEGLDDGERREALREYSEQTAMQAVAFEVDPQLMGSITRDWQTKLNMSPEEVSRVADLINYLENTNNADAGPMAQFVTETGSLAQGLDISNDQLALMSTLFGVGGFTGSPDKLATVANSMFTRMASGGGGQSKMFNDAANLIGYMDTPGGKTGAEKLKKEFGKDPFNTLVGVMESINKLEDKDAWATAIKGLFGQAAVKDMSVLLNSLDKIPGLLEEINSGGYMGSVAEEYSYLEGTYAFKKAQFEEVWGNFLIDAGQPFMEGLKEVWEKHGPRIIEMIPTMTEKFSEISDTVFQPGGPMDRLIDLIPTAADAFADFLDGIIYFAQHPVLSLLDIVMPGNMFGAKGILHNKKGVLGQIENTKTIGDIMAPLEAVMGLGPTSLGGEKGFTEGSLDALFGKDFWAMSAAGLKRIFSQDGEPAPVAIPTFPATVPTFPASGFAFPKGDKENAALGQEPLRAKSFEGLFGKADDILKYLSDPDKVPTKSITIPTTNQPTFNTTVNVTGMATPQQARDIGVQVGKGAADSYNEWVQNNNRFQFNNGRTLFAAPGRYG